MSPHDAIERAARRIERETGLHFSGARRRDLPAAFARMAREAGHVDGESLASWLVDGPWDAARTALCARHLTIGETYFFREPRGLDLLCEVARTKLAADPQAGLRVWSAGCATGEEPYSMALALRINVPQLAPERTAILATDLNPASLETARAGVYREWSFRRTAPVLRSAWFCRTEAGQYRLREDVRCQVRFAQLNLAQGTYPPDTAAMDVIFCRNVLMYFSRSQMREVIARLRDCLAEGGWLVVNPSEASSELFAGFTPRFHPDAVLYRKDSRALAPPAAASAPASTPPSAAALPSASPARPAARRPVSVRRRPAGPEAETPPASPGEPAEALRQASVLAAGGDAARALKLLVRAVQRWPLASALHLAAGELALAQGERGAALRHLQRHLYLEPDSILGHYLAGVARMGEGSDGAARREFAACEALLARVAQDAAVPGVAEWQAATLRASVRAFMERMQ